MQLLLGDRTAESVRKKWTDWSSSVKSKEVARRQAVRRTGGGGSEDIKDLTQVEEKVVHILGKVVTEGIPGAIDTSSNNQETSTPPQDKIDMMMTIHNKIKSKKLMVT